MGEDAFLKTARNSLAIERQKCQLTETEKTMVLDALEAKEKLCEEEAIHYGLRQDIARYWRQQANAWSRLYWKLTDAWREDD